VEYQNSKGRGKRWYRVIEEPELCQDRYMCLYHFELLPLNCSLFSMNNSGYVNWVGTA
jgi:hypothetical protein